MTQQIIQSQGRLFWTSLNCIKQNGLEDNDRLTLHQTVEVLHPHEYGILSVRVGTWQGLC